MDLNLTPEERQFRDELRAWLDPNVPKDWAEWREKPLEETFPYLRAWQRKLDGGRWAAVSWPKEYGGRSATLMQQAIFWEEMSRAQAPPMANALGLGLIGPTIIAYGTEAQKKRFVPKILAPKKSGVRVSPNQTPALISQVCRLKLDWMEITTSSTAKRCGPATAPLEIGASWLFARMRTSLSTRD